MDASHALTISAHTNLGTSPIVEFGTDEQKRRYVPLLARGKVMGGFGLTEPGAGSDAGGTASTAVDKGDHYLLNGAKIFITHAGVGEIFSLTARPSGNGNNGITSFIVTKDTVDLGEAPARRRPRGGAGEDCRSEGREEGRQDGLASQRHPRAHLRGCHGSQGKHARPAGLRIHEFPEDPRCGSDRHRCALPRHRRGAYEQALRYAGVRKQFGAPIGTFQGVHFQLADMALEIEAGTHLLYHAAWLKQNGKPFKKEAAMAKLFCSELAMR